MSWWKWSRELNRSEWRGHVTKAVKALVGGDWEPVAPYDMMPPGGRSTMLIGSDNVPGKSGNFRIEVEMFDTNNEPLPPPGSGRPWKTMDSEHGLSGVSFTCQVSDVDSRRIFAKSNSLRTPYEVADFSRTAINGYFGDDDGEDEIDEPAPYAPDNMVPTLVTAAKTLDVSKFAELIHEFYGGPTKSNYLLYGDCVNFAVAAVKVLQRAGIGAEFVFIGWDHAAVRAGSMLFDGGGRLTSARIRAYATRWNKSEAQMVKDDPGYVPLPGKFITSREYDDVYEYGGTFDADGVEVPEIYIEVYDSAASAELAKELAVLARKAKKDSGNPAVSLGT